jgi:UDP-2,3-diacylglucosamine pyrophosphatase LpxH
MIKTSQPHPMCLKIEVLDQKDLKFALFSDLHLDNTKCRRDLLKKDLDEAYAEGRWMIFNGDTFCFMQGKYDPRRNKSDIRTEDNSSSYIDNVIENAAEFFAPYADRILMFSTGNHESSILKNVETNVLNRFTKELKLKTGHFIYVGGYHGWVLTRFVQGDGTKRTNARIPFKIYYNHGAGGDPAVSK